MGVVPQGTDLPVRNRGVPAWADLTDEARELFARQMEVYAGFLTHTDEHVGRLLDHLRETDQFDNTLILLLSDNGASAEGGRDGLLSEISYFNGMTDSLDEMREALDRWGDDSTYPHYALGWAYAGSTPQQWYKSFVHEGGTRDPLIVSWPDSIDARGEVRDQFHHVVDIARTVYDAVGIDPPDAVDGVTQRPLEGEAMNYSFDNALAPTPKTTQFFEMFAHRALWADGWKAVTMHRCHTPREARRTPTALARGRTALSGVSARRSAHRAHARSEAASHEEQGHPRLPFAPASPAIGVAERDQPESPHRGRRRRRVG